MDQEKREQAMARENKMGTVPIPRLLLSMSLPAIISMFVQALYNIVDSIFVAQVSENALTAVSLAFPIQMIIVSCFVGMGVGINSGISRRLGERRHHDAESIAEHGFIIAIILSVILGVLGFAFSGSFVRLFTDVPEIITGCTGYLIICTVFCFGSVITQAGFSTLQGSGEMIQPMIGQLLGAVINIVLDPIMIFGLLGFPAMGVLGAAVATVTGQIVAMIYILCVVFFRKKNLLKLSLKGFTFRSVILRDIIAVGLPSAIMQGIGSFMLTGYNLILASYGMTAVAVFGVYFKIQSFVFMPVFGLGQGAMPIFGFNYGARSAQRFNETAVVAVVEALAMMLVGLVLFQVFPTQIFGLFNASPEMLAMGIPCFRAISWSFPIAGISIMLSVAFQAMGRSYLSLISSFLRQIILLLPITYWLSLIHGLDTLWYGFIISDFINIIYVVGMYFWLKKKELDQWPALAA